MSRLDVEEELLPRKANRTRLKTWTSFKYKFDF